MYIYIYIYILTICDASKVPCVRESGFPVSAHTRANSWCCSPRVLRLRRPQVPQEEKGREMLQYRQERVAGLAQFLRPLRIQRRPLERKTGSRASVKKTTGLAQFHRPLRIGCLCCACLLHALFFWGLFLLRPLRIWRRPLDKDMMY